MGGLWRRLVSGWRATATAGDRPRIRRGATPGVSHLEERKLLYVTPTATVVPSILIPSGRTVPVNVSGTVNSVIDLGAASSIETRLALADVPEPVASFQVTDLYRRVEPRGRLDLDKLGGVNFEQMVDVNGRQELHVFNSSTYYYTVNIPLQADRSSNTPDGRRYYILISAGDQDNGNGVTVPVLVPQNVAEANQALVAQQIRPVRDAPFRQDVLDFRADRARLRGA